MVENTDFVDTKSIFCLLKQISRCVYMWVLSSSSMLESLKL